MTVCIPRRRCAKRKIHWKSASSEAPVTISGVTKERYSDPDNQGEPRFHKPYAASVPMMVAATVATMAMIRLFAEDSMRLLSSATARYHWSENLSHTANREELKLKIARISKGTCRNA